MPSNASDPVPPAEILWARFREFLGQWGVVEESPRGWRLMWDGRVTEVELTREQLRTYVAEHLRWRADNGLAPTLDDGLPPAMTDSFGDCFGPQEAPYARVALVGLDFRVVADAP
ncbi:hypothetical protein ACFJIY_01345 [Pimelobacter simplex]|uniref:hypothetical protein n=1 Tax=Nocardioides simplex TaxID=2045 RepID=UPI00366DDFB3